MSKAYSITQEEGQLVIRLDRAIADQDALNRLLGYLDFVSIQRGGGQLDGDQVAALAEEVDQAVWEQIRHKYEGE